MECAAVGKCCPNPSCHQNPVGRSGITPGISSNPAARVLQAIRSHEQSSQEKEGIFFVAPLWACLKLISTDGAELLVMSLVLDKPSPYCSKRSTAVPTRTNGRPRHGRSNFLVKGTVHIYVRTRCVFVLHSSSRCLSQPPSCYYFGNEESSAHAAFTKASLR